jgi:hypothetical protein
MMGRQQDDQAKLFYEFSRRPNSTGLLPQRTHCYVRRPVRRAKKARRTNLARPNLYGEFGAIGRLPSPPPPARAPPIASLNFSTAVDRIRQHPPDGGPFIVGEFIPHDSSLP